MDEKDLKKYDLYVDTRREMLEIVDRIIEICKMFLPSRWRRIKSVLRSIFTRFLVDCGPVIIYFAIFFFIIGPAVWYFVGVMVKEKVKEMEKRLLLKEGVSIVSSTTKPFIGNTNFYRDGDLLICEVDMSLPTRNYIVTASFVDNQGREITKQDQTVMFNEVRKVKFLIPYNSQVEKVKIYVK